MRAEPGDKAAALAPAEILLKTDKTTLALEALPDGKLKAHTASWPDPKIIARGEVVEIRNVWGSVRITRKRREPDAADPPVEAYDPYGPGPAKPFAPGPADGECLDEFAAPPVAPQLLQRNEGTDGDTSREDGSHENAAPVEHPAGEGAGQPGADRAAEGHGVS